MPAMCHTAPPRCNQVRCNQARCNQARCNQDWIATALQGYA